MPGYWTTLSHNGVNFPDPYKPEGLSVVIKGVDVPLTQLAEEMAYNIAKKKDTPYIQDPVFTRNFMGDFGKELPGVYRGISFIDIDFSEIYRKVDAEKAAKDALTKEGKKSLAAQRKERREQLKAHYGKAILDGKEVEIANWMVEPPGLFMGRGAHPIRGRWKPRVSKKDVVLNLGESAPVPPGEWKEVVHDHKSMWMAKWVDRLTDKEKYVWLHESAPLQQSRNKAKYDNAMRVGSHLEKIRAKVLKALESPDESTRQVATVCYLIDTLGMRVGDEKDEDEADTVGASTLRVEHVKINGPQVEFNFLGKDSVPWNKSDSPPSSVLRNLREFSSGKAPASEIFHNVDSGMVNQFLSSTVPGLSAKVFRTFHATRTAEAGLRSRDLRGADETDKVFHAKEANLKAAVFCNHQRTPPKTWEDSLKKKELKLQEAKASTRKDDKRVKRLQKEVDFFVRTKNYNLSTAMKNYIDPRVYKAWCDYVGLDWARIYSKSLQRKFSWAAQSGRRWQDEKEAVKAVAQSARQAERSP